MKDDTKEQKPDILLKFIRFIFLSPIYPFFSAALIGACYYLGLEVISIVYLGLTGTLIFLFAEDVTPAVSIPLYMNVFISWDHSPSTVRGNSDYLFQPAVLVPMIIVIVMLVASIIFRFVLTCKNKKFRLTPMFFGLCFLSVALFLNGVGNKDYIWFNLMFAALMSLALLVLFTLVKDGVSNKSQSITRLCYALVAWAILLTVELIVIYITKDDIFVNGKINRGAIVFGWGVYTYFGVFAISIPAALYLAITKKLGCVYTALSVVFAYAVVFSCCRHAMVTTLVIYPICLLILLLRGKYKITNLCILAVALIGTFVLTGILKEHVIDFFKVVFANFITNGELNGSGRIELYKQAIKDFKDYPVFGRGFFKFVDKNSKIGFTLLPRSFYHNTVLEFMGSCGTIGLAAYAVHRLQTVISYLKKINVARTFLALIMASFIISSLLDIHFFGLRSTMLYTVILAVFTKSGEKEASVEVPPEPQIVSEPA